MRLEITGRDSRGQEPIRYVVHGRKNGIGERPDDCLGVVQRAPRLRGPRGPWEYVTETRCDGYYDSAEEAAAALQRAWDDELITVEDEDAARHFYDDELER